MTDWSGPQSGSDPSGEPKVPAYKGPSGPPDVPVPAGRIPSAPLPESFVLVIGDIGVSPHWVVTPNGSAPLRSVQWIVRDMSRTEERIPAYAIVLAIIFFLACLLGLLFLLIKERRIVGYVEVAVRGEGLYHVVQIPATGPGTLPWVNAQVHQARSLAARLG